MTRTIAALLAVATIAGIAAPAAAQTRYYARERLSIVAPKGETPPPSPPTYSRCGGFTEGNRITAINTGELDGSFIKIGTVTKTTREQRLDAGKTLCEAYVTSGYPAPTTTRGTIVCQVYDLSEGVSEVYSAFGARNKGISYRAEQGFATAICTPN